MVHVGYSSSLLVSDFGANGTRGIFVVFYCYQTLVLVAFVGYSSSFIFMRLDASGTRGILFFHCVFGWRALQL